MAPLSIEIPLDGVTCFKCSLPGLDLPTHHGATREPSTASATPRHIRRARTNDMLHERDRVDGGRLLPPWNRHCDIEERLSEPWAASQMQFLHCAGL